ncbi:MAG TPA: hypothetical protein VN803_10665 [Gemmatimonadales bacterium]|nr:hypothetical protein [Gemmatimonadales bacterium]
MVLASCSVREPTPAVLRLDAMIAFPPKDTIRFSLPATSSWCNDGHSLLVEALHPEGSGVLVRVRYRDSLTSDSVPIVLPDDTATVPAAVVGIRFFVHDTPRSYSLDSGRVHLQREGTNIRVTAGGIGVESAIRIRAELESRDVPLGTDTVPCTYAP